MVQPVHRRGIAAHPAPAAAGAALAGRARHLLDHKVKALPLWRHLPLADGVHRVGNVAQGIRHAGQLARRAAQPLRLHGRGRRGKDTAQRPRGQRHRRRHTHPGTDGQRHGMHRIGGRQRAHRTARRKDPGAAPALPGAEAGRCQTAQRDRQRRKGKRRAGCRDSSRQRDAQHRRLFQRSGHRRAQPRPGGQRQARSQGPGGTALQAGRGHRQPQADAPRLPRRKMRKRPAEPRRQQGGTPHRDGLGKILDVPHQQQLYDLRCRQRQTAGQHTGFCAAIDKPPYRGGRHCRHPQLDPQQRRLKRQPCRQRAERRRHTVGGRAADDERQPKRRRPAIDLPGPQCRAAEQRRPLPQQRRAARAGQQLLCVDR